ncbi:hypothetical protein [Blastococcus sp. PRF04-17]|uniref:hypothetical protein n=1 Tax=Blastococcus sp. PRF04-17 TaxID=2933797 RepID=UPI001FF6EB51|nr:hypothetical protein [Blastococcus sp. PRF04-17]UOX99720.1 hypothetical protein MVA48_11705 [Blastococcus sp. PRF04-17]
MPLRSVEAASRDDAIAAAREQFGPQARVVGVRRVRSGGVLGFFATERYVAEVAPEPARPSVPVPSRARAFEDDRSFGPEDDVAPADFSSPLASAAPARARGAAPARNGAAAWAAEATRSSDDSSARPSPRPATAAAAARSAAPPPWQATPVHPAARDEDRVSELAGLLGQQQERADTDHSRTAFPRASFPRTGTTTGRSGSLFDDADDEPVRDPDQRIIPGSGSGSGSGSGAPSPFTAALARMVAGDHDVQQAVQEALEQPAAVRPRAPAVPSPTWPGPIAPAETSVTPAPARQEEETVGDQVIAPPAPEIDHPVDVPTWAAEPEVPASSASPARRPSPTCCAGHWRRGTPTRHSPASSARSSPAPRRRRR